ncbi:NUDIX domain-containing protein [Mycoplasmatota bacterium]|nr:NUDIX domain-containing protein [Mycoplasmatota bacterium]
MELWDVYNKHRQKTGRTHKRGIPLNEGDYHLVVHVWIVNDQREYLIQKRQPWKTMPNMWDCSAAGSAIVGDNSEQAAIREVKEEIGVDLDINKGQVLFTHRFSCGFDDIWLVKQNIDLKDLKLQYEEVAEAKWVTYDQIKRMVTEGRFINYHYLNYINELINSDFLFG